MGELKYQPSAEPPDLEALLCALVLDPSTFSRNRCFEMYQDPMVRRVRRRAALVRSIVRQVSVMQNGHLDAVLTIGSPDGDGMHLVSYHVPSMDLRRQTRLDATELALVRFIVAATSSEPAQSGEALDADRDRIEAALQRLAG